MISMHTHSLFFTYKRILSRLSYSISRSIFAVPILVGVLCRVAMRQGNCGWKKKGGGGLKSLPLFSFTLIWIPLMLSLRVMSAPKRATHPPHSWPLSNSTQTHFIWLQCQNPQWEYGNSTYGGIECMTNPKRGKVSWRLKLKLLHQCDSPLWNVNIISTARDFISIP